MTSAHQDDALDPQKTWSVEVLSNEKLFRIASLKLVAEVRTYWESQNLSRVRELIRSYAWVGNQCLTGWRASVYDFTSCSLAIEAAHYVKSCQHVEQATQLLGVVQHLLMTGGELRVLLGETPRPFTQVRLAWLNLLGDCKWTGPVKLKNYLQTPAEMVELFFLYDARIREYTAAVYKDKPDRATSYFEDLMWTANTMAKVCLRYFPEGLERIIHHFAEHYGEALTTASGAYQSGPPNAKLALFFWDFEIAKLWLAYRTRPEIDEGLEMLEAMDYCHKQRDAALDDLVNRAESRELLRLGWQSEWRLIRRDLLPKFEVV